MRDFTLSLFKFGKLADASITLAIKLLHHEVITGLARHDSLKDGRRHAGELFLELVVFAKISKIHSGPFIATANLENTLASLFSAS